MTDSTESWRNLAHRFDAQRMIFRDYLKAITDRIETDDPDLLDLVRQAREALAAPLPNPVARAVNTRKEQNMNQVSPAQDDLNTAGAPAEGKWVFDEGVANSFSDMLEKSIPGYHDMRDIIYRVGRQALLDGTSDSPKRFIDLGASNGESAAPFIAGFGRSVHARLLDVSQPMLDRLGVRFREHINAGQVSIRNFDLRKRHNEIAEALRFNEVNYASSEGPQTTWDSPDLVLAILTLIFVPINFRANVLRGVYEALKPGGMFLITEKLQGNDYATDNLLVDTYHALKHDNGYSWEAIERKRLALEHAQIPLTAEHNERDLRNAGFRHVECVHRHLNFATFVAIK